MKKKNNIRVLIAEDDFLLKELISSMLKDSGYIVLDGVSNGRQAIEKTCSLKPDVVLMDIQMPKVDGLEATRKIQQSCSTPVVIMTAYDAHDIVDKASEAGASAYLVKPPASDEIERAITISMARHDDLMKSDRLNVELRKEISNRKRVEKELKKTMKQLERFNKIAVNRELRMIELKKEINELLEKTGTPKKYLQSFMTTKLFLKKD